MSVPASIAGREIMKEKQILTVKEVIKEYPISKTTLWRYENEGILKPTRKTLGKNGKTGKNLYSRDDLDFFFGLRA